ncbi:hypothetical protein N5U00_09505 [Aliarcobacter butzleri]|uniref:hypothetical protein n=1 Tax=Aliarcobacter butzleri TaxID=28197 RepID=UPI0021B5FA09|nr:hypothetical protein [Aliarcobacter butzleri]MCT7575565.1 hypothetical protein [Aliarcobacter butzleri]
MKTFNNSKSSQGESKVVKYLLITTAITFLAVMLVVPLITIFAEAFRKGVEAYFLSFALADLFGQAAGGIRTVLK